MNRALFSITLVGGAIFAIALLGCNSTPTDPADSRSTGVVDEHAEHGEGEHGDEAPDGESDMELMKAALAKLSPEDAASAEKQHFCPVSGEMLGSMGTPQQIDVNGRQVWICCEHCKEDLLANPDKYLAKLKGD